MALSCSCDFDPEPGDKCWWPREILDAQKEYWELTGFEPEKYENRND